MKSLKTLLRTKALLILVLLAQSNLLSAQQDYYPVTAGNGFGVRLWNSDSYKIHMGNSTEYKYGPVSDFSIKMNMSNTAGRGWTWGVTGLVPVAALNTQGDFQVKGDLYSLGKVGVGITDPIALLDVGKTLSSGEIGTVMARLAEGNTTGDGTYLGVKAHTTGTVNGKSFALEHAFYGNTNSAINFHRGGSTTGGFISFGTNNNTERMRINKDGDVGIGTTAPDAKLTVKGKIHSEEVKVDLSVPAPDYVFLESYDLRTLEETQDYIEAHGHLPNIPAAAEMEENGIELGVMNMKLLEKIEELTLYILEQNQLQKKLEARINALESKK